MVTNSVQPISIIVAAAAFLSAPAVAETYASFDTGNDGELLMTLPGDSVKRVVFSVDVGTVSPGDILIVDGETEMTNDSGDNALFGAQLVLSDSPTATNGVELDEANTFNITPDMHHGIRIKSSIESFPTGNSRHYVNFAVWTNHSLTVEQDYGRLQIVKISP